MTRQVVKVQELFERFGQILDFVCEDEDADNEAVVQRPDGENVVIIPHARYVALQLALGTFQRYARGSIPGRIVALNSEDPRVLADVLRLELTWAEKDLALAQALSDLADLADNLRSLLFPDFDKHARPQTG